MPSAQAVHCGLALAALTAFAGATVSLLRRPGRTAVGGAAGGVDCVPRTASR
jgi:hypothetical protein